MDEKTHKQISQMNEGKAASLVMNHMADDLSHQRQTIISKLKQLYRAGKATEALMLAGIAELCTLDDLENRLNAKINRGNAASKELENAP